MFVHLSHCSLLVCRTMLGPQWVLMTIWWMDDWIISYPFVPVPLIQTSKWSLSSMVFHAFIYSICISWVLTMGLQCTPPTCPLCFLPIRPPPLPWEDPSIHPPASDCSNASPTAYLGTPTPLARYNSDHDTSLCWKARLSPHCLPDAISTLLLTWYSHLSNELISWCVPNMSCCNHMHSHVLWALTSFEKDWHFHFARFILALKHFFIFNNYLIL